MASKKINWTYRGKEILCIKDCELNALSFIYRITLLDNSGRYYIGRKTILRPKHTKGPDKGKSKGEYPWKTYCGSSKELTAIIKSGVNYSKEIIYFCYSKAETTYLETKEILCTGSLIDPKSFNFWVKATIYSKHLK